MKALFHEIFHVTLLSKIVVLLIVDMVVDTAPKKTYDQPVTLCKRIKNQVSTSQDDSVPISL